MTDIIETIYNSFRDKDFYVEEIYPEKAFGKDIITISIEGDWKHDHGYCDYLMSEMGYYCFGEKVLEDTGSDWYPAEHYYCTKEDANYFNALRKLFSKAE